MIVQGLLEISIDRSTIACCMTRPIEVFSSTDTDSTVSSELQEKDLFIEKINAALHQLTSSEILTNAPTGEKNSYAFAQAGIEIFLNGYAVLDDPNTLATIYKCIKTSAISTVPAAKSVLIQLEKELVKNAVVKFNDKTGALSLGDLPLIKLDDKEEIAILEAIFAVPTGEIVSFEHIISKVLGNSVHKASVEQKNDLTKKISVLGSKIKELSIFAGSVNVLSIHTELKTIANGDGSRITTNVCWLSSDFSVL